MNYCFPNEIFNLTEVLIEKCRAKCVKLSTAESCTGGLLSGCLTDIVGSSDVLERGFVTYSNQAKHEELGVTIDTIEKFGAVSDRVAIEMCKGALTRNGVELVVSLTGIAGPDGGTELKPVGLVYIGIGTKIEEPIAHKYIFNGNRYEVRTSAILKAIELLTTTVDEI